jgi:hypothetical protein
MGIEKDVIIEHSSETETKTNKKTQRSLENELLKN